MTRADHRGCCIIARRPRPLHLRPARIALFPSLHAPARRPARDRRARSPVHELTDANWDAKLSEGPFFIMFYTKWCSQCKNIAPEVKKVAKELRWSGVSVGAVDLEDQLGLQHKFKFGQPGHDNSVPTMKVGAAIYTHATSRDAPTIALSAWSATRRVAPPARSPPSRRVPRSP